MKRKNSRLSWDDYWRLTMKIYGEAGGTKSFPEEEMRKHYELGHSPLQAMDTLIAKYAAPSNTDSGSNHER